jgi:alpha-beta hydrolase superfamily lysophospholipase
MFWKLVAFGHAVGLAPWAIKSKRPMTDRVVMNVMPEAEREAAFNAFVYESGSVFNDMGNWPIDETQVRVPVLTVAATQDRLVTAKLVRLTGKKYAAVGGDFVEYADHGHWLYAEPGWEKPASEIYDWLHRAIARTSVQPVAAE